MTLRKLTALVRYGNRERVPVFNHEMFSFFSLQIILLTRKAAQHGIKTAGCLIQEVN
jgi:hypothetical protein